MLTQVRALRFGLRQKSRLNGTHLLWQRLGNRIGDVDQHLIGDADAPALLKRRVRLGSKTSDADSNANRPLRFRFTTIIDRLPGDNQAIAARIEIQSIPHRSIERCVRFPIDLYAENIVEMRNGSTSANLVCTST